MNENLEPKIEKAKEAEEINLLKFYKNERYTDPKQIEDENKEVLLSNFREEIKEIQKEIKQKIKEILKNPNDEEKVLFDRVLYNIKGSLF